MITSSRVPRPLPRWWFIGLVLVSLTLTPYRAARAQDSTTALTDEGLRQLAEVLDGVRTGGLVWVVMCGTEAPYDVLGHYFSLAAAQAAVAQQPGKNCRIFGPHASTPDYPRRGGAIIMYGDACRKRDDSSCASSDTMASIREIDSVTVTLHLRGGRARSLRSFRPQDGEAILFTMAAVDKLLIPYFHRVYGLTYAQRERTRILRLAAPR